MIKKAIAHLTKRITVETENVIVVKIDKKLFGTDKDVNMFACYIPPYNSPYWNVSVNGYGLDLIENCIFDVCVKEPDCHLILCGDFNARTGTSNLSDTTGDFEVLSAGDKEAYCRTSQDEGRNVFGDQLIELCEMIECLILNGLREIRLDDSCTYIGTAGSSLIDYYIMSKDLFSAINVKNLFVENRVESDHMPISLTIETMLYIEEEIFNVRNASNEKIVWNKCKEDEFFGCLNSIEIQNIFTSAQSCINNSKIEEAIDFFVKGVCMASKCMVKKVVTGKRRRNSLWFDQECQQAKRVAKQKLRHYKKTRLDLDRLEYVKLNKDYKLLIKQKRQAHNRKEAENLASSEKSSADFWKHVRNLIGNNTIDESERIDLITWFNHFQDLFKLNENEANAHDSPLQRPEQTNNELNCSITEEEVILAIRKLKSGKAGGLDGVLSEMLKAGKYITVNFLTKLFNAIFDSNQYPTQWAKAVVIPIHKKGATDNPNNYRGISLLSAISKCFTSILNRRLYKWMENENKILENQAGFRKEYTTIDHIFTLHAIAQSCLSRKGRKLYVAFVDFKKAFDSVNHVKLMECLQNEGVQGKFYEILKTMYQSLISCVRIKGTCSDFFHCPKGVRQGCVLSPTLFSLFINKLAEHVSQSGRHGVQLLPGLMELFILLFADDVTLISTSTIGLQNQLDCLKQSCEELKLEVNIDKTKIIVFRKGGFLSKFENWKFNGQKVEVVNEYCYLGYTFTTMLSYKNGTKHLVGKGKKAVFNMGRLTRKCREVNKNIFFKIFDMKVQPILLYSAEIWGLTRLDSIEKVQLMASKRFLGVPIRTPNKMIYSELGRFPLYINASMKVIKYWFRILQMSNDRLPKQAYSMLLNLDCQGYKTWVTEVREMLSKLGFYYVWNEQRVENITGFINVLKQRLQDIFCQEWSSAILNKDRYAFYRCFKEDLNEESYINDIDVFCFRSALTQMRLGVLPINNNMYRYNDNPNTRHCPFCIKVIENEKHFLCECPLYKDLRDHILISSPVVVNQLFRWKSKTKVRLLSKFICKAYLRRKEAMLNLS